MPLTFKGWIPTVTGRLSFSSIGHTNHPTRAVRANVSDSEHRAIICFQRRNQLDVITPLRQENLSTWLFRQRGDFVFLCISETKESDYEKLETLEGSIYIIDDKEIWRNNRDKIKNLINDLTVYEIENKYHIQKLKEYCPSIIGNANRIAQEISGFFVNFRLERTGEISITYDPKSTFRKNAPKLRTDIPIEYSSHIVISQLFYFIRDIAHAHQHHHPQTDTIVDIYLDDGKESWKRETTYSLFRKIIQYKRQKNEKVMFEALGVLSYAQAFLSIFNYTDKSLGLPKYDIESLRSSIVAAQQLINWQNQNKITKSDKVRNILLTVLSVTIAFTSLMVISGRKFSVEPNKYLDFFVFFMVQYPIHGLALVALSIYLLLLCTNVSDPGDWPIVRGFIRLLFSFKRRISLILVFGIGLIFSFLTIFLTVKFISS
jgi:hypothetical protein